jgi:hypothetical protein
MEKKLLCIFLAMLIFSQGCCSIFTNQPQKITVKSKPEGADVKVGPYKGKTPFEQMVPRGKDYLITADYQGKSQIQNLEKKIEPIFWINILFWPGMIIDLVAGDMFKYEPTDYEFDFTAPQQQTSAPQPTDSRSVQSPKEQNSSAPASSSVIKCGNCGHEIVQNAGAFVHKGKIVCSDCYAKLKNQQ